jgi:hypothetical protein
MQVQTLQYDGRVWAGPFPEDDFSQTLVLIYGANLSPDTDGNCDLPNRTMTLTVIGECS